MSLCCSACKREDKDGVVMSSYMSKGNTYDKCSRCNAWGGRIATVKKNLTPDDLDTLSNLSVEDNNSGSRIEAFVEMS